jgi:ATP-dependent Lhr-like helicase
VTTQRDAVDRLSPAVRYQIVNGLGWSGLRPVQALATEAILDGANCVVLAPTAGGKTEAAFLPLLSKMDVEDWRGVAVLYVAPIRALLNNQEARLTRLTGLVGRRAGKWHGDVKASARRRLIDDPPDVLAITPESLEAMLLSARTPARRLLAGVQAVVVDEVHAFAGDDRGAHLVALLERISRIAGPTSSASASRRPSATPRPSSRGSAAAACARVGRRPGRRAQRRLSCISTSSARLDNAALLIDRLYPGTRRLVFVDSRRRVEELGHRLSQRGVDVYLSHSSLALSERAAAEAAFEEGTNCVIVATSALELGPRRRRPRPRHPDRRAEQVSSFLQRMGRTGRRAGLDRELHLPRDGRRGPPARRRAHRPLHARLHRAGGRVALGTPRAGPAGHRAAMQEQGAALDAWWVAGSKAARPSARSRQRARRHRSATCSSNILVEADPGSSLGARGEKLYGAKNFLELYAVFSTPRVLRVMYGRSEVGVVDASFLQDKERESPNFVLAGRPWRVVGVDWKGGTCAVEPAESGGYPRWLGRPLTLERSLCQAMRRVLQSGERDPSWSKRATAALEAQRESNALLDNAAVALEEDQDGRCRWWTFGGGAGNRVLAGFLELALGARVSPSNTSITFAEGAAESVVAIRQAIDALAERAPLRWADATRLVDPEQRSRVSKFQPCLPPAIEHGLIARETLCVDEANETLAEWRLGGRSM